MWHGSCLAEYDEKDKENVVLEGLAGDTDCLLYLGRFITGLFVVPRSLSISKGGVCKRVHMRNRYHLWQQLHHLLRVVGPSHNKATKLLVP